MSPAIIRITKEAILEAGLALLRDHGPDALNARALAARLKCSTQPIFSNFPSMDALLDSVYTQQFLGERLEQKRNRLMKKLRRHESRVEKKLTIHQETLLSQEKNERLRLWGELLTANLYQVSRGAKKVELINYYTGDPIEIPLDPALSPAANAQRYFKRYGKFQTAASLARTRVEELSAELSYLREMCYNLEAATSLADMEEIRQEMLRLGYEEAAPKEKPKHTDPLARPLRFRLTSGLPVMAGRNSRQNDALTLRVADGEDWWFHAKNLPGSHVILFAGGQEPTVQDLTECCILAVTLSGAKHSGKTAVDYTQRKNVWKAKGALPGMVLYESYKTAWVSPDGELAEKLSQKEETESY